MTNEHDIGILQAIVQTLEKRIIENEMELQKLTSELQAWSNKAHAHCPACGNRSLKERLPKEVPFAELPLPEALMICLLEFDYPVSPRTLRLKLEERGYPREKLGRYANRLHTVVWRLTDSGRIRREEGDEIVAIR